ncbi:MAG: CinA family nicotinamide mononucleotide deamidase-related protein [Leptospiraceae bacterium]|nr:CinA family nicotinamide mononucleotide deamidase-related protein [Leptospiraceae bacterium]MCK6380916.1 CinA family nicotinamide mononucleotide deamidase-related protein [Leptospiraceae bacterium]NUM40028.1 CinA family nicotinamide mononucleotide deamidase-related protein [Leptospiraceae bacterium]
MSKSLLSITVISTGSEFTSGKSIDTNSSWIANELFTLGFQVNKFLVLPDSLEVLKENICNELYQEKNTLVIMTGGLGPTEDDYTLDAICAILKKKPLRNEKAFQRLENFFQKRGKDYQKLIQEVEKQTRIPEGSTHLENSVGIAAGFFISTENNTHLIAMPGVPAEMKPMFCKEVVPILKNNFQSKNLYYDTRWVWGIGESYFQSKFISNYKDLLSNITWGVTAKSGYIQVSFCSEKMENISPVVKAIEKEFEPNVSIDIFQEIHKFLTLHKMSLGTAESCTGGFIAKKITDLAGASEYFLGSIVSYSNKIKMKILGVEEETLKNFGAVSEETAKEMVIGAENKLNCEYSISITGIAGPGGGTETKKVGLCYIAVKKKGRSPIVEKFHFPFTRELFRDYASNMALFCLYKLIQTKNL